MDVATVNARPLLYHERLLPGPSVRLCNPDVPRPAPPRPYSDPRRYLHPDQALFVAVCMGGLQRLVLLQCPVPPATLAAIWQHRRSWPYWRGRRNTLRTWTGREEGAQRIW